MLYLHPRLDGRDLGVVRLPGPGLGNLLFPWARAVAAARRHGLPVLFPTWPQLKLGPLLRGERDPRTYFGLFRRTAGYVGGLRRLRVLARARRMPESALPALLSGEGGPEPTVVVFEGQRGLFAPILGEHAVVRRELLAMSRPRHLSGLRHAERGGISLHVRLGDFMDSADGRSLRGGGINYRSPLAWFVAQVAAIRRAAGPVPAWVFSDGRDEELAPLLALPDVRRVDHGSSLADVLALSQARVLVGSAGSSFSTWPSYLGRMPVIWHVGKLWQRLYPEAPDAEVEADCDGSLPAPFLELAVRRLRAPPPDDDEGGSRRTR